MLSSSASVQDDYRASLIEELVNLNTDSIRNTVYTNKEFGERRLIQQTKNENYYYSLFDTDTLTLLKDDYKYYRRIRYRANYKDGLTKEDIDFCYKSALNFYTKPLPWFIGRFEMSNTLQDKYISLPYYIDFKIKQLKKMYNTKQEVKKINFFRELIRAKEIITPDINYIHKDYIIGHKRVDLLIPKNYFDTCRVFHEL